MNLLSGSTNDVNAAKNYRDCFEALGQVGEFNSKNIYKNIEGFVSPPNPLIPKTVFKQEQPNLAHKIPFMQAKSSNLPQFTGRDEASMIGDSIDRSILPYISPGETTLRGLFDSTSIVYKRTKNFHVNNIAAGYYNANLCDVKKLADRGTLDSKEHLRNTLEPWYKLKGPQDRTLLFESRFETGNLEMAGKVSDNEYRLLCQNDTNSRGNTQWYFFRVNNTTARLPVRFHICNFVKPTSLYNKGMKILVYSKIKNAISGQGWHREGKDILYYSNGVIKDHATCKYFQTLSFTYIFQYDDDEVYFAYSYPYTYTQLQETLDQIEAHPIKCQLVHRKLLCRTIGNNRCDYVTITNRNTIQQTKNKKGVLLSSRVHPGETISSWMMQGILEFLTSESNEANYLRQMFVFKIVPMLNPDGVINGNYRCNLLGTDLNRRWRTPSQSMHPIVYHYKKLIHNFKANHNIELICDLHGHSRKKNAFMYGCEFDDPAASRLFPYILSKISPVLQYRNCNFESQRDKEGTLRVALHRELQIPNIFTLEASFCGSDFGMYEGMHFTMQNYKELGRDLCLALITSTANDTKLSPAPQSYTILRYVSRKKSEESVQAVNRRTYLKELTENLTLLHQGDNQFSGSDSEPSEDNMDLDEIDRFYNRSNNVRKRPTYRRNTQQTRELPPKRQTFSKSTMRKNSNDIENSFSKPQERSHKPLQKAAKTSSVPIGSRQYRSLNSVNCFQSAIKFKSRLGKHYRNLADKLTPNENQSSRLTEKMPQIVGKHKSIKPFQENQSVSSRSCIRSSKWSSRPNSNN